MSRSVVIASRSPAHTRRTADQSTVGPRQPCPCGSGRRYKACHGRPGAAATERTLVSRPFAGLRDECDWVALREVVPAATAPLTLADGASSEAPARTLVLATVLPMGWPALVRPDGSVLLGLQVPTRSGDVSRDLAHVLELALAAAPGTPVLPTGLPGPGSRLQDLLAPVPLAVSVHDGFDFWLSGVDNVDPEVTASMERANSALVPTARLSRVAAAYWCRIRDRAHLRWVLPYDEEPLLDALARLAADGALGLGSGSRYVGSFRAHGLLVPVWDLAPGTEADAVEEPAAQLGARLDDALADTAPLTAAQRRARGGLLGRQLTLR